MRAKLLAIYWRASPVNTEQFSYWLQGYSEITGGRMPTESEWQIIQDHLKLVFEKKTPSYEIGIQPARMPIYDAHKSLQDAIKFPNVGMITC